MLDMIPKTIMNRAELKIVNTYSNHYCHVHEGFPQSLKSEITSKANSYIIHKKIINMLGLSSKPLLHTQPQENQHKNP